MANFSYGLLYIDKDNYEPYILSEIRNNLMFSETDYFTNQLKSYKYFYEDDRYLLIPKYYNSVHKFPFIHYNEYVTEGSDINIEMIKCTEPRDPEQQKAIDFILNNNAGIIKAYTGFGKTWCAIKAICNYKKKTLIIVNKKKLLNQWVDEFVEFTNLTKDDIGIISGRASIKKALKKPIIISVINTLGSIGNDGLYPETNDYLKEFIDANIGLTILDEVHKTSVTPYFSKGGLFFVSKKIFGLSATPKKSNKKLTDILKMYFNNNMFIPDESNRLKPKIVVVIYDSKIPMKSWNYIKYGGKFIASRYRKLLLKSDVYNKMILKLITTLNSYEKTRGILYVAHEIDFLKIMKDKFEESTNEEVGLVIGNSDESETKKRIINSTYQMITDGLSIKHLNKLIQGTPISSDTSVEQLAGRITRDHTDKEAQPEIFDLVDVNNSRFIHQFKQRLETYTQLGYEISACIRYDDQQDKFVLDDLSKYL